MPRSGASFGLPKRPGVSAPVPPGPGTGVYVRSAVKMSGCCPDCP
jgi:hypothetical protein